MMSMGRPPLLLISATAAVGTTAAAWIASKLVPSWVEWMDPIRPSKSRIRASLRNRPLIPIERVEEYIQERKPVVKGAEQRVVWTSLRRQRTKLSVVFLHGWSACHQECAPIPQRIAKAIQANLYLGRLPGHGRLLRRQTEDVDVHPSGEALLKEATPRELILYALDAYRIGLSLGERVVLVGMSTGGCLATWLASVVEDEENERKTIAGLVLISPAYSLGHPLYPILKNTFSFLRLFPHTIRVALIELVLGGKMRSSPSLNDDHHRYTCLSYPSEALLNLLDVLWECEREQKGRRRATINIPTIMLGNPQDPVVNFRVHATNLFLQKWGTAFSLRTIHI